MRPIAIIGAGGMARDALHTLAALGLDGQVAAFFESRDVWRPRDLAGLPVRALPTLDATAMDVLVAIGSGGAREALVEALPADTVFPTYIHPSVQVGPRVDIGAGSLVCAGSILTTDIRIGRHAQLNIGTFVTHDCVLGDFVTASPGVRLNGNCTVGARVLLGTGACVRERTTIAADSVIGMGAVVLRDVAGGTWVGNPARRLR